MANRYPFHIEWSEEDQEYVATCPAFPGLSAFGETEEEAVREGKIAMTGFIETCREKGIELPEPVERGTFSGKLQLRLSRTQHRRAVQMAELEGVSLNTYIAEAVTARVTGEQVARPMLEEMRRQLAATSTQVASALVVQPLAEYSQKFTKETILIERTVSTRKSGRERGN